MVIDYLVGRILKKKGNESPLNEKLQFPFDVVSDSFGVTRTLKP
jgi:hypothetical protein